MKYHKLVRDRIPALMEAQGQKLRYRILDDREYTCCLEHKLDEEVAEYHADKTLEELADILEVVYALAGDLGASRQELQAAYEEKHALRGGFQEKIFLMDKA